MGRRFGAFFPLLCWFCSWVVAEGDGRARLKMVMKEVDDQLTVFLEMQRREQEIERGRIHLLPDSDKVDALSGAVSSNLWIGVL